MLLAIDTDILAYKATTSSETEVDWGGDIWSLQMDMAEARRSFEYQIDQIKERLGSNEVLCCLSDHAGNFRKQVWPDYKSNRRKSRKPVGYVAFCDWVRETYATATRPMLEADDVKQAAAAKVARLQRKLDGALARLGASAVGAKPPRRHSARGNS